MSLVTELAERAHELAGRPVPESVAAAAQDHLTDTVGALIAGYGTLGPRAENLIGCLGFADPAPGTPGALRRAAFLGGAYSHAWEIDDIYREAVLCPGCVILPAMLAVLDLRPGISWQEFLRCYVIGYEVALSAALKVRSSELIAAGWWPTALIAPLGGAAAVSVLLGRTVEQTASAIALAAQQAGGVVAGTTVTSDSRYLLGALAAERSVTAVLTAEAGWIGPEDILDHPRSPFRRADPSDGLADEYLLPGTSIKPYAGPKHLQAAIDALLHLREQEEWSAADILEITCYLPRQLAGIVDRPEPFGSSLAALASAQFVLASAALRGRSTPAEFSMESVNDETIIALSRRIRVVTDEDLSAAYPRSWGARIEVTSRAAVRQEHRSEARGDPGAELSRAELARKFTTITESILGVDAAAALVRGLLEVDSDLPLSLLREHVLPILRPSPKTPQEV